MTKTKTPDDENITTSFVEADLEDRYKAQFLEVYAPPPGTPKAANPVGKFSGGAGTADIQRTRDIASWVILIVTAGDLSRAASALLGAWKHAERGLPSTHHAEFHIVSHQGSASLHGVLEIGEYIDLKASRELGTSLKVATSLMVEMANQLAAQGYECTPR